VDPTSMPNASGYVMPRAIRLISLFLPTVEPPARPHIPETDWRVSQRYLTYA
jgi:hypothetical protein